VEGCSKVAKDPDQEKILAFIDDMLKSKHDEGKFTELDLFWYVSILSQTRILPLPNRDSCVEKIVEYIGGLCKPYTVKDKTPVRQQWIPRNQFLNHDSSSQVWEKDLLQGCEEVGKLIGADICINMQKEADRIESTFKEVAEKKKDYHCSLSSSSCIEHGRSEGGKWNSLTSGEFKEFLETPVCDIFEFKNDSWVDSNNKLVCYNEHSTLEIWKIAYLDKPLEGSLGEVITPGYLPDATEAFCLGMDARLGTLMYEWSCTEYSKFINQYDMDKESSYPQGRVSIVKEPGIKIRPVTCGTTWQNVFLSPAAHTLRGFLEALPACRVGLSESNGLFRFSQEYKTEILPSDFISTSDMNSATDRAPHETGFGLLNGLINELSSQGAIEPGEREYLKKAAALLTTPKRLKISVKGKEKRAIAKALHDGKIEGILDGNDFYFTNYRGIMMGDPLTKIVLTASSYGAWRMTVKSASNDVRDFRLARSPSTIRTFSKVKAYACAGDDHLGIGPKDDLERIPKAMESMGYEISWEKYNINKKYVSYCQLFGMLPDYNPVTKAKTLKEGRQNKFIQIDVPKIRLLTQFQKMGGKENFDKPDPLVGKALQMFKDIEYARETIDLLDYKEDDGMSTYVGRLKSFISMQACYVRALMPSWMEWKVITNPLTYLSPEYGGLGLHLPFDVNITTCEEARNLAARSCTKAEKPKFNDTALEWERGVKVSNVIINKLVVIGDMKVLSENEVKESAREEIISNSAAGPELSISNMKLYGFINSKYTCLDREIPLVSSKENAYVHLMIDPATGLQVVKKMRARQLLTFRRNELHKYVPKEGFDWEKPSNSRSYVRTESLRAAFQTGFVMPNLRINQNMFSKNPRKYPRYVENVESVRDLTEIGSFDASIDESQNSVGADSSTN